ncbi:UDP-2,3-diacylglucosamine diphosphatase [Shewanella gelidii]|uniref:UDP-2,3-diacylglucosamine hydrolase n=1 Tax=Shewanella gelidii TaxID=1642821 RepID=A0A917N7J8_9GAMM|nr:UDP-2,3-diacylglucosamine diphosphatase [Shewanella gelidii]MCL1097436.1 UDP-2,3-diacylglucosamine diphosphatase [Shewanella gelidii]GGI75157.1 UDP-2,3-diacylglucosamine hydrolase [Shewanella gelidii]
MKTLFIADLHLSADRPDITAAFERFIDSCQEDVDALYILGDLFEIWMGDDLAEPFALNIAAKLKQLSQTTPIFFIHGNRDFLISKPFAKAAGLTLLPEVCVINLYGTQTVILHGDSLCTLDKPYQRFRRFRNSALIKWLYAHLPTAKRRTIANNIRQKSQQGNQQKSYSIMDVENSAVEALLQKTQATLMIHGHTHRPDIHQLEHNRQRIVLGDWYEQGSMLSMAKNEMSLSSFKL